MTSILTSTTTVPPGSPSLGDLVWHDDLDGVRTALSTGIPPNEAGPAGYHPLHQAAHRGNLTMIRLLLDAGADPTVQDHAGFTPMDHAMGARTQSVTTWPSSPTRLAVVQALQHAVTARSVPHPSRRRGSQP